MPDFLHFASNLTLREDLYDHLPRRLRLESLCEGDSRRVIVTVRREHVPELQLDLSECDGWDAESKTYERTPRIDQDICPS